MESFFDNDTPGGKQDLRGDAARSSSSCYRHSQNINAVRLMNCFDTPPRTTMFGTKNSVHWDSFKSKYAPSTATSPKTRSRSSLAARASLLFRQGGGEDRRTRRSRRRRRGKSAPNNNNNKKSLVWKLLRGCWKPPPQRYRGDPDAGYNDYNEHDTAGFHCEAEGLSSSRRRNRTPLVERYSEYFDRRRNRSAGRLG